MKRLSFRAWLSIGTLALIAVILFFSRRELQHAWQTLGNVDLWVLALVVPVVALGHISAGEMIFSYLRKKGHIKGVSIWTQMRISMELNFVNHLLPSGGVSGVSYMNWRLSKFGIRSSKATIAQAVRYVGGFAAMIALLVIAVVMVTMDGTVNRWIILMSSTLVSVMIIATLLGVYLLKSVTRMDRFASAVARIGNRTVELITFGKVRRVIKVKTIQEFLGEMHEDMVGILAEKRLLIRPFLWGIVFAAADIAVFWIVFWALGSPVNPAPILIGYGLASFAGFLVVTPGGAGAYEVIMVGVLAIAGMAKGEAIAGIVLTRVIMLLFTIIAGYIFYQQALIKYGKRKGPDLQR